MCCIGVRSSLPLYPMCVLNALVSYRMKTRAQRPLPAHYLYRIESSIRFTDWLRSLVISANISVVDEFCRHTCVETRYDYPMAAVTSSSTGTPMPPGAGFSPREFSAIALSSAMAGALLLICCAACNCNRRRRTRRSTIVEATSVGRSSGSESFALPEVALVPPSTCLTCASDSLQTQ